MPEGRVSRTAAYVAAARAIGAREPDATVRNPDYLAGDLIGDPGRFDLDLPVMHALGQDYESAMQDPEVAGTVRAMIVRTRFIDEALERAVAGGARQLLVLGAGFDSHAYRFASLLAGLRVFEVDGPATQAFKQARVRAVVGAPPANLTYVAIDVERENLRDCLSRHGYDFTKKTFVIMEGLTMYLTEGALRETFGLIAQHPAGTSVVFDFVPAAMVQMIGNIDLNLLPPPARKFAERFLHLTRDEPWIFGLPHQGERDYIQALGFDVPEMLVIGGEESARRYLTRQDGSEVGAGDSAAGRAPTTAATRTQAEGLTYRIAEAFVPWRH